MLLVPVVALSLGALLSPRVVDPFAGTASAALSLRLRGLSARVQSFGLEPGDGVWLARPAIQGADVRSKHRDNEDGAVILAIPADPETGRLGRLGKLHCEGHLFKVPSPAK